MRAVLAATGPRGPSTPRVAELPTGRPSVEDEASITADLYSHVLPAVAAQAAEIASLVPRARLEEGVTAM